MRTAETGNEVVTIKNSKMVIRIRYIYIYTTHIDTENPVDLIYLDLQKAFVLLIKFTTTVQVNTETKSL